MANEKILILEAPWSNEISDTRATKEIYSSAETLLAVHDEPVRIIQRPLLSSTYLSDIEKFVSLPCNQRGPNIVIFSAHGSHQLIERGGVRKHRRKLEAFDGPLNMSTGIRKLNAELARTIIVLDACKVGTKIGSLREAAGALGTIGFSKDVSWVDSSIFVLALLLRFQQHGVFHLKRARKSTGLTQPKAEKVLEEMKDGPYKSLWDYLGVESTFAP